MKVNIGRFYANDKPRTIKVQVDRWDTYNVDHTLSLIALPLLKQFKEQRGGATWVGNEDVPESMFVEEGGEYDAEWGTRWDYVIGEMIFAFECCADCNYDSQFHTKDKGFDVVKLKQTDERIANGLRLFGKYFRSLWT